MTSELLSLSTGCNPVTIKNIISALKKDGIIDVKPGTGGTTLAVPLQDISLYSICSSVDPQAIDKMIGIHSKPSPFCPVGRNIRNVLDQTYDMLKENLISSMKNISMEKLCQTIIHCLTEIVDCLSNSTDSSLYNRKI